jgi:AraC-like DNA-binding protein
MLLFHMDKIPSISTLKKSQENTGKWSPFFVSSDVQETRHTVGQGICDHVLEHRSAQKRPVSVRYRSASLTKLTLHDMAYSMFEGEARIFVPDMSHIYLCEINLSGTSHVGQKKAEKLFSAGQIYMINANRPHTKRWESDGHQLMVKIHQTDIEAAIERATGMPMRDPVIFSHDPQDIVGKIQTLAQMVELFSKDIETEQSFFAARSGSSAEELLIDLILEAIPNNYTHKLASPEPRLRPRHVRHAAEYIHTMSSEKISFDDLVKASGVSPRSLHAGFKKYYDLSPMVYLKNVRLDIARLELKHKSSATTSVTEVAMTCGFTHLSKFASSYKDRFGELPSETLRNA